MFRKACISGLLPNLHLMFRLASSSAYPTEPEATTKEKLFFSSIVSAMISVFSCLYSKTGFQRRTNSFFEFVMPSPDDARQINAK